MGSDIKKGIVDTREKTCSYRVFQIDQLVCAHAIATCITERVDYISLRFKFYTKESLVTAYAQLVEPVGDMADWQVLEEIRAMKVNPPIEAPPSGRSPELKITSVSEDVDRRTVRCGRRNKAGHNRKRCKNPIALDRN